MSVVAGVKPYMSAECLAVQTMHGYITDGHLVLLLRTPWARETCTQQEDSDISVIYKPHIQAYVILNLNRAEILSPNQFCPSSINLLFVYRLLDSPHKEPLMWSLNVFWYVRLTQAVEQTVQWPVIWTVFSHIWHDSNEWPSPSWHRRPFLWHPGPLQVSVGLTTSKHSEPQGPAKCFDIWPVWSQVHVAAWERHQ